MLAVARAKWDADGVRDDLRGYVVDHLGDADAVLVLDETGDLKKGVHTVGVQRQYTGTAGRIENAQVAVYLTYAAPRGHAFIDRALYLPKAWTDDADRCATAGVPAEVGFATKPALAAQMVTRAIEAGAPAGWVAGDEVYGADPGLRATVRGLGLGHVLQIAANRVVPTQAGGVRVDQLALSLPSRVWQQRSAGAGSKGHRWYSWAWIALEPEGRHEDGDTGQHHLLIRRNDSTGELAYHRCYAPHPVPLQTLVRWPGNAGGSRSPSRPPRNSPGWTNTRSAAGPPGTAGPRWPSSPTPSSETTSPAHVRAHLWAHRPVGNTMWAPG